MNNIAHLLNALIIVYTFLLLQGSANAAFWEDHFEQEAVDDWKHVGNDSVWTVEDGFLRAEIQAQTNGVLYLNATNSSPIPVPIMTLQSLLKPLAQRALDSGSHSQSISKIP